MSSDKNSEPFDFDFDALDNDSSTSGEAVFDLDNPFGDDIVVTKSESIEPLSEFQSEPQPESWETPALSDEPLEEPASISPEALAQATKKKGFFSRFSKDKTGKAPKEPKAKKEKPVKEKIAKEKTPEGESVPRDWGTILCLGFSGILLVSLLFVNVAAFLSPDRGSIMQTLCFLGAFNILGLIAAGVPLLFYKLPQDRNLPNVMLGVAAFALFLANMMAVTDFFRYF